MTGQALGMGTAQEYSRILVQLPFPVGSYSDYWEDLEQFSVNGSHGNIYKYI